VPVVVCIWRRPERLRQTVEALSGQSNGAIRLCIWNNRRSLQDFVETSVADVSGMNVDVVHSTRNVGGFGRFYFARRLAAEYPFVVFLDDDQVPSDEFLSTLTGEFRSGTIHGAWGYRFRGTQRYADRVPARVGDRVKYCGTGGMICDTRAFLDAGLFRCPRQFWFVEDLWLSYYADHVLNWPLYKSAAELRIERDEHDQFRLLGPTKDRLFRHLVGRGWDPVLRE
jgi:hypothetical protein